MWRYLGHVSQVVEEEGEKRVRNTMRDNACHSELNDVQMMCNGLFIQMFSSLRPSVCQGFHVSLIWLRLKM